MFVPANPVRIEPARPAICGSSTPPARDREHVARRVDPSMQPEGHRDVRRGGDAPDGRQLTATLAVALPLAVPLLEHLVERSDDAAPQPELLRQQMRRTTGLARLHSARTPTRSRSAAEPRAAAPQPMIAGERCRSTSPRFPDRSATAASAARCRLPRTLTRPTRRPCTRGAATALRGTPPRTSPSASAEARASSKAKSPVEGSCRPQGPLARSRIASTRPRQAQRLGAYSSPRGKGSSQALRRRRTASWRPGAYLVRWRPPRPRQ